MEEQRGFINAFQIKLIAALAMLLDHIAHVFLGSPFYLRAIGRLAFPIFAYLITQGYIHTRNIKKYEIRLLLFAIIAQLPYYFALSENIYYPNVIFTLLLGILAIHAYDNTEGHLKWIIPLGLVAVAELSHADHGAFGVVMILIFYIIKPMRQKLLSVIMLIIIVTIYQMMLYGAFHPYYLLYLFYCAPLVLICFYNGQKGPGKKLSQWAFYLFYPLHLAIIAVIKYLI